MLVVCLFVLGCYLVGLLAVGWLLFGFACVDSVLWAVAFCLWLFVGLFGLFVCWLLFICLFCVFCFLYSCWFLICVTFNSVVISDECVSFIITILIDVMFMFWLTFVCVCGVFVVLWLFCCVLYCCLLGVWVGL